MERTKYIQYILDIETIVGINVDSRYR